MSESEARQKLMSALLAAVQQCQVRYGGKSELATENEEVTTFVLLCILVDEIAFALK